MAHFTHYTPNGEENQLRSQVGFARKWFVAELAR